MYNFLNKLTRTTIRIISSRCSNQKQKLIHNFKTANRTYINQYSCLILLIFKAEICFLIIDSSYRSVMLMMTRWNNYVNIVLNIFKEENAYLRTTVVRILDFRYRKSIYNNLDIFRNRINLYTLQNTRVQLFQLSFL